MIGVTLDREDGGTPMETDGGEKGKQSGSTYYIDTNQLRVARENMEVMSPLKNGMSESVRHPFVTRSQRGTSVTAALSLS